jgi:hypothetical protein
MVDLRLSPVLQDDLAGCLYVFRDTAAFLGIGDEISLAVGDLHLVVRDHPFSM